MERDTLGQTGDVIPVEPVRRARPWTFHVLLVVAAAGVTIAFPGRFDFSGLDMLQGWLWAIITVLFAWTTVSTFRKRRGIRTLGWTLVTLGAATLTAEYLLAGSHTIHFTVAATALIVCGFVFVTRGKR